MAPSRQHSAGHNKWRSGPSALVNRQKQDGSMASRRVLKTAGARRRKPEGTKPIEEPRWELLKHWHASSEVIANWNQQWVRTDEWGKKICHIAHMNKSCRTYVSCQVSLTLCTR